MKLERVSNAIGKIGKAFSIAILTAMIIVKILRLYISGESV